MLWLWSSELSLPGCSERRAGVPCAQAPMGYSVVYPFAVSWTYTRDVGVSGGQFVLEIVLRSRAEFFVVLVPVDGDCVLGRGRDDFRLLTCDRQGASLSRVRSVDRGHVKPLGLLDHRGRPVACRGGCAVGHERLLQRPAPGVAASSRPATS